MSNAKTRLDRTRHYFQHGSWNMDAADAWQHVLNGACDDEDLNGDKQFSALDMDDMFCEYRAFGSACNDAVHYLIDNVDSMSKLAGFIYIDCCECAGEVEFVNSETQHDRAEWLFGCAQDGVGVLLRAVVDCVDAICIELAA